MSDVKAKATFRAVLEQAQQAGIAVALVPESAEKGATVLVTVAKGDKQEQFKTKAVGSIPGKVADRIAKLTGSGDEKAAAPAEQKAEVKEQANAEAKTDATVEKKAEATAS